MFVHDTSDAGIGFNPHCNVIVYFTLLHFTFQNTMHHLVSVLVCNCLSSAELHERISKIDKLRKRYEILMVAMSPPEGEEHEEHSQAYYVIKVGRKLPKRCNEKSDMLY